MSVVHMITGYDRVTERLSHRFEIPAHRLEEVRRLAHVPPLEEENFGAFPINSEDALTLASRLDLPINTDRCDWFLEPFAGSAPNPESATAAGA